MSSPSIPFLINWDIAFVSDISIVGPYDLVSLGITTSRFLCFRYAWHSASPHRLLSGYPARNVLESI